MIVIYRIIKTEYNTFIIENKKESDNLNYFEFFLKCVFGVKKYYWQPDYFKIFDTFEEAADSIKPCKRINMDAIHIYEQERKIDMRLMEIAKSKKISEIPIKNIEKSLVFDIESTSFTVENNHGILKIKLPCGWSEISHFKAGMKVKVKLIK